MFPVVDHRPGDAGHDLANVNVEGIAQVNVGEQRRVEVAFA